MTKEQIEEMMAKQNEVAKTKPDVNHPNLKDGACKTADAC